MWPFMADKFFFFVISDSRSLPIHCVIEQTPGEDGICPPNGWRDSNVVLDTYAIIPGSTLFVDIVSASLFILGYSPGEVAGAKGKLGSFVSLLC